MSLYYFTSLVLIVTFLLSFAGVILSRRLAIKQNILDDPKIRPDKLQKQPIPFLGGLGIVFATSVVMSAVWLINKFDIFGMQAILNQNLYYFFHLAWILIGLAVITVGGFLDDKYALSSKWLLVSTNLAVLVAVIGGGLKIETFSAPFDSLLPSIALLPELLAYLWIMLCLAATKFLDGLDGLVGTVSLIAFLSIASVSMLDNVNQPLIFIFALIWAVSIISFLIFNFPNAKLYLGEIGSEGLGFMIGVLSILSGAKVATASTVIGWFILDVFLVFGIRMILGKPVFKADRTHIHHRLLHLGLDKLQVLVLTTVVLLVSAHVGLLAPTQTKIFLIPIQLVVMVSGLWFFYRKRNSKQQDLH